MKSVWQSRILLFIIITLSLTFIGLLQSFTIDTSVAQGIETPTDCSGGGFVCGGNGSGGGGDNNGGDDDDDNNNNGSVMSASAGARVSGFAYNYSNAASEGGVTVVVDGGGWQVETVTDTNGFYQIGNLGTGQAIIYLRLPPDSKAVTANWPLSLVSEANIQVNLGFYWGDDPPIPVILSGQMTGNQLSLQIKNNTPITATGGLVQILPPVDKKVSGPIVLSQGQVAAFNPRHFQINTNDIPPDEIVTINLQIEQNQVMTTLTDTTTSQGVRVVFTYNQGITPQVITLDLNASSNSIALTTSSEETGDNQTPQAILETPGATYEVAQDQAQAISAQQNETPSAASTDEPEQTSTPEAVPPTLIASQSDSAASSEQPEGIVPLPVTGTTDRATNIIIVSLATLLMFGLGIGGWQATKKD